MKPIFKILALATALSASSVVTAHAVVISVVYEGTVTSVQQDCFCRLEEIGMEAKFALEFDTEKSGADFGSDALGPHLRGAVTKMQITKPALGIDDDVMSHWQNYEIKVSDLSVNEIASDRFLVLYHIGEVTNPPAEERFFFIAAQDAALIPWSLTESFTLSLANGGSFVEEIFHDEDHYYNINYRLDRVTYSVSPVPVPFALPLLATGLGIMGTVSRKRRRTG